MVDSPVRGSPLGASPGGPPAAQKASVTRTSFACLGLGPSAADMVYDEKMSEPGSLPRKLLKPPLIEAVFELRFASGKSAAGDLLPGLLYQALGSYYSEVQPLPLANVPRDVREKDANLRFRPTHRLIGETRQLQVGDRVALISQTRPYEGWAHFKERITEFLAAIRDTKLVDRVERYSFKCVNLVEAEIGGQLSRLNARLEMGGQPVKERGFRLRTEWDSEPYLSIVQVGTNANANLVSGSIQGMLLEVDTVRQSDAGGILEDANERLDEIHDIAKPKFFSMLTEAATSELDPVWGDE